MSHDHNMDNVLVLGALLQEPEAGLERHLKNSGFSGSLLPSAVAALQRLSVDPLIGGTMSETRERQARALRGIALLYEKHPELRPRPQIPVMPIEPVIRIAIPRIPPPDTKL